LQLFVEGGILLAVPVGLAVLAGVWGVIRRLQSDRTAVFWIRAGAVSAMMAVAAQNVWDTGLRMPPNAVLFAIVAAIALHAPDAAALAQGEPRRGGHEGNSEEPIGVS